MSIVYEALENGNIRKMIASPESGQGYWDGDKWHKPVARPLTYAPDAYPVTRGVVAVSTDADEAQRWASEYLAKA